MFPALALAALTALVPFAVRNAGRYWRADFGPHPKPPSWWAYGPALWKANLVAGPSWAAGGICMLLAGWAGIALKLGVIPAVAKPVLGIGFLGLLAFVILGAVAAAFGRPKFVILPGLRGGPFLL